MRVPVLLAAVASIVLAPAAALPDAQETAIGQQVFQQLSANNEIVARPNPLYAVLDPIALKIDPVADALYDEPFTFVILHDPSPNAFAAPGGNVYVNDSLFTFVQNREEFASVLCHEVAHDIDHDLVHSITRDQQLATLIGLAGAFSGAVKTVRGRNAENLAYALQVNSYALDVEGVADLEGADICAEAGYNPWGMVWLFERVSKVDSSGAMEALSDPISERHRIDALERHFLANPQLFGAFSANGATAQALLP